MKYPAIKRFLVTAAWLASALLLAAQTNLPVGAPAPSPADADQRWSKVQTAIQAVDPAEAAVSDDRSAILAAKAVRAANAAAKANQAKEFYMQFPQHANSLTARKQETILLLEAVQSGDTSLEARLDSAVSRFRADATVPVSMRAEVAGTVDFSRAVRRGSSHAQRVAAIEAVARALIAEFPSERQGYESLFTVARLSDDPKYLALLQELSRQPAIPDIHQNVQRLMERQALVGTRLADLLDPAEAPEVVKAIKPGQPVVLYSWSGGHQDSVRQAGELGSRLGDRAALIGLNFDRDAAAARQFFAANRLPGTSVCGLRADGRLAGKLKLAEAGVIYLIDAQGVIREVRAQRDPIVKLTKLGF